MLVKVWQIVIKFGKCGYTLTKCGTKITEKIDKFYENVELGAVRTCDNLIDLKIVAQTF